MQQPSSTAALIGSGHDGSSTNAGRMINKRPSNSDRRSAVTTLGSISSSNTTVLASAAAIKLTKLLAKLCTSASGYFKLFSCKLPSMFKGVTDWLEATATTSAAIEDVLSASTKFGKGNEVLPPAMTKTCNSSLTCKDEETFGNGKETPSSGNISHALSAPSISNWPWPSRMETSSPITTGSSLFSLKICNTSSAALLSTMRVIPMPQLNVAHISADELFDRPAIQRNTAGSSHVSACTNARKSFGKPSATHRFRPPLVIGEAAFNLPAFTTASTDCAYTRVGVNKTSPRVWCGSKGAATE
mmetsp:Transcript_31385/g.71662  ORF Transcript_31385/g.71662 Transcript_31385/m.71662 type:complete len:301 (-) Transcript_31385:4059-4961(-)